MEGIGRKDLILLLLGVEAEGDLGEGINGITRLQKLLFLLQKEGGLRERETRFEFEAYKAGPYSGRLYDDLEFLENIGLIEGQISGEATEEESSEVDFTFEELIGDSDERLRTPDVYDERRFRVTTVGKERISRLLEKRECGPVIDGIRKIKSKFGDYSLDDLLYYVYTKYPDMATESEIKDKILRRRRRT